MLLIPILKLTRASLAVLLNSTVTDVFRGGGGLPPVPPLKLELPQAARAMSATIATGVRSAETSVRTECETGVGMGRLRDAHKVNAKCVGRVGRDAGRVRVRRLRRGTYSTGYICCGPGCAIGARMCRRRTR